MTAQAVAEAKPFLSYGEVDKGVGKIRMLLLEEKQQLLSDIEYITQTLEQVLSSFSNV